MTMLKIQSTKKNEKGIALLFTLVMLSLLLILALSFALDSMFAQKAAYNSASTSSSAFMGQAQLKQVLLLIKNGEANFDASRLYSHDFYSTTDTDMLLERLPVSGVLEATDGVFSPTVKVNWNYTKDADGKIIGRTAFVVIPEDKIPLDSLVDSTVNASPPDPDPRNEKENIERRIGRYMSEINVRGAIPNTVTSLGTTKTDAMTTALNWKAGYPEANAGFTNGKYTGIWSSYASIFDTLKTAGAELNDTEKSEFESNLNLNVYRDKEAFWAEESTGDRKIDDNTELYQRFNLARSDWTTANNTDDIAFIKDKILLTSSGTSPDVVMTPWSDSTNLDGLGIPWLACFGYKDDGSGNGIPDDSVKGTFSTVLARRCQIAANLKDYCDTDSRPTSDLNPETSDTGDTWLTTGCAPTYTGNELTPYIDKLGVMVESVQVGTANSTTYDISATVELSVGVGLVNIYKTAWTAESLKLKVSGNVTVKTTIDTGTTDVETTLPFSHTLDVFDTEWGSNYSRFVISSAVSHSDVGKEGGFASANKKITFKVSGVTFTKVVLYKDGGIAYDYLNNISQTVPANSLTLNNGVASKKSWFGYAVHDPRQNLNSTDWQVLNPVIDTTVDPACILAVSGGDPYYGNSNSGATAPTPTETPSTGPDAETGTETGLSTAHIRNGPMESPWELGFIHRGAKWETVNLKKFDSTKAIQLSSIGGKKYILGGGAYTSGDANILDQIKMTGNAVNPQKINLNTTESKIFETLLYNVRYGCTVNDAVSVDSMGTGGTALNANSASPVIKGYTQTIASGITAALTRASAADKLLLPGLTSISAATDAAQEELIGKIINLTKFSNNVESFTVIILAQTIKDIDTGGVSITKYAGDGTTSYSQPCSFGTFDFKNYGSSKTNVYFDEITGTQKIMATCRFVDGKVEVVKFEYCE